MTQFDLMMIEGNSCRADSERKAKREKAQFRVHMALVAIVGLIAIAPLALGAFN